jgi:hypothetical protein
MVLCESNNSIGRLEAACWPPAGVQLHAAYHAELAWEWHGMSESGIKTAGERHGMCESGFKMAGERHGMCESAFNDHVPLLVVAAAVGGGGCCYVSHKSELVVMYVSCKCKHCSNNVYLTQAFGFQ